MSSVAVAVGVAAAEDVEEDDEEGPFSLSLPAPHYQILM